MALVIKDRIKETATTTGTGTFTLGGAISGFQAFSEIGNGNTTYYCIEHQTQDEFEVGLGTYTLSGTTLARTTIITSSNAGNAVNFSAGDKNVFVTVPATKTINKDASNNIIFDALSVTGGLKVDDEIAINTTAKTWDASTDAVQFQSGSLWNFSTSQLNLDQNVYYNGAYKYLNAGAASEYSQASGAHFFKVASSGSADANITFSTALTVANSGNVGIGLTDPDTPLEVQLGSSGNALKLSSSADGASVFLAFEQQESGTKHVRGRIRAASNGVDGGLIFETGASSSTSERMRIDSSGNVGLGTSSPNSYTGFTVLTLNNATNGAEIDFEKNGTVQGSIFTPASADDFTITAAHASGDLIFQAGGYTERMRIGSGGRIGIGESNPDGLVHLTGDTNSNGAELFLQVNNNNTTDNLGAIHFGNNADSTLSKILSGTSGANNSSYLTFSTSNAGSQAERMRIDSSGQVGIGEASPSSYYSKDLVVKCGSSEGGITIRSNATTDTNYLMFADGTSGTARYRGYLGFTHNSPENMQVVTYGYIRFYTGDPTGERMRIDTSGNLLVGTTTSGGSGGVTLRSDGVMVAPAVYGTVVSASLRDIQMDSSGFFGYSTSTRATKGNIENLSDVSWLYSLNPVSFNRKVNGEELSPELEYGLIAEDVEEVNAELCFYNETDNGQELAGITYSKLITPLLKALQEANERIETLEAKVTALENA